MVGNAVAVVVTNQRYVAYGGVADYLARKRMRRHFMPPVRETPQKAAGEHPPEPPAAPAEDKDR